MIMTFPCIPDGVVALRFSATLTSDYIATIRCKLNTELHFQFTSLHVSAKPMAQCFRSSR